MASNPFESLTGLTFKQAFGTERTRARELLRRVYASDLGHIPDESLDELAHYLIAQTDDGEMLASFRLLGPEHRPFDIEHYCNLSGLLSPGALPALGGRLSVRHDQRRVPRSMLLHLGMLKLMYAFAQKNRITDILLYTEAHLINFYRGAYFSTIDCSFILRPDLGMMHVMRLNLQALEKRLRDSKSPRALFILAENLPNFIV